MPRFRCHNPACGRPHEAMWFEWVGDEMRCPKCGANLPPYVMQLATIHLVVPDEEGPILGRDGRHRVVCQPEREVMAMSKHDDFHATDDPRAVTCTACKRSQTYQEMARLYPVDIGWKEFLRKEYKLDG